MSQVLPTISDCCNECCGGCTVDCNTVGSGGSATVVDTTAMLRIETFSNHKTVWLLGDQYAGDGSGGLYYFDSASLAADAPVAVVRPGALGALQPGRWIKHI